MTLKIINTNHTPRYAVKTMGEGRGVSTEMLKEVYALARLCDTPGVDLSNIVRYYGAWQEGGTLYCQMELCESTLTKVRVIVR